MKTVVIKIKDWVIQEVISDEPVNLIILDDDTDGLEPSDLRVIDGVEYYLYQGLNEAKVKPDEVAKIVSSLTEGEYSSKD